MRRHAARVPPTVERAPPTLPSAIVGRATSQNTVVVTIIDRHAITFALNWARHLRAAGVETPLVGLMNIPKGTASFLDYSRRLGVHGALAYSVDDRLQQQLPSQGGRWFYLLPLLKTGVRVLLSDSDVVWLRDPRPYFAALESAHPMLDFSVSTDSEWPTDGRRLSTMASELDVEGYSSCLASMNIGIMHFPPRSRPGSLRAVHEMVAHLSLPGNLKRVDQGPINHRWKRGADGWLWKRPMHPVKEAEGWSTKDLRLCALVNGTVNAGVLPLAQFGNTLSHGLLNTAASVSSKSDSIIKPFAVHATWMRSQEVAYKIWRLRELGYWYDHTSWYEGDAFRMGGSSARAGGHRTQEKWRRGFLSYTPQVPPDLLQPATLPRKGGVVGLPYAHLRLMREQLSQLRNALFLSRALNRTLILPRTLCSCELGFHPKHVQADCYANGHGKRLTLPHACSIDHYLDPNALSRGGSGSASSSSSSSGPFYSVRESSFLSHPLTPRAVKEEALHILPHSGSGSISSKAASTMRLPRDRMTSSSLRRILSDHSSRRLHFEDVRNAFGGFDGAMAGQSNLHHSEAQTLLSSWCCTQLSAFGEKKGLVPYLLPPLEGSGWRGAPALKWVARALSGLL